MYGKVRASLPTHRHHNQHPAQTTSAGRRRATRQITFRRRRVRSRATDISRPPVVLTTRRLLSSNYRHHHPCRAAHFIRVPGRLQIAQSVLAGCRRRRRSKWTPARHTSRSLYTRSTPEEPIQSPSSHTHRVTTCHRS